MINNLKTKLIHVFLKLRKSESRKCGQLICKNLNLERSSVYCYYEDLYYLFFDVTVISVSFLKLFTAKFKNDLVRPKSNGGIFFIPLKSLLVPVLALKLESRILLPEVVF